MYETEIQVVGTMRTVFLCWKMSESHGLEDSNGGEGVVIQVTCVDGS